MPSYLVTDSHTGKKYKLTGDSPPTDTELEGLFGPARTPADQSPDMAMAKDQAAHPYQHAALKSVNEALNSRVGAPAAHFANQLTLNNLRGATEKLGGDFPSNPEDPTTNVLAHAAGVAGAVVNPLNKAALLNLGRGAVAKGLTSGAISGAAYSPEDITDIKTRALQSGIGATLGAAGGYLSSALKGLKTATSSKAGAAFSKQVAQSLRNAKKAAVNTFGEHLDRLEKSFPDKTVSLRQVIDKVNATAGTSPDLNSVVNRSQGLKRLVNNPELANEVPLTEVQSIINEYKANLPQRLRSGKAVDFNDFPVLDIADDIKAAQLDAFPELAPVREEYAKFSQQYETVKKAAADTGAYNAVAKRFGNPVAEEASKKLLDPKTQQAITNFRRGLLLKKGLKIGGGLLATKKAYDIIRD